MREVVSPADGVSSPHEPDEVLLHGEAECPYLQAGKPCPYGADCPYRRRALALAAEAREGEHAAEPADLVHDALMDSVSILAKREESFSCDLPRCCSMSNLSAAALARASPTTNLFFFMAAINGESMR